MTRKLDLAEVGKLPEVEVVRVLRQNPAVWRYVGDLSMQARHSFARAIAGKNTVLRNAAEWKADELRHEIAGPAPTPLERLLADRIAACWVELHALDLMVSQEVKPGAGRLAPEALEAADKRRGRAHKRYLAAIHELALVRRLLVPAVRVHIDQRRQGVPGVAEVPRALPALPP